MGKLVAYRIPIMANDVVDPSTSRPHFFSLEIRFLNDNGQVMPADTAEFSRLATLLSHAMHCENCSTCHVRLLEKIEKVGGL